MDIVKQEMGSDPASVAFDTLESGINKKADVVLIDTAGRSGTYDEDKAREITNDVQHCRELADEHTIRVWDTWSQAVNIYASTDSYIEHHIC